MATYWTRESFDGIGWIGLVPSDIDRQDYVPHVTQVLSKPHCCHWSNSPLSSVTESWANYILLRMAVPLTINKVEIGYYFVGYHMKC